MRRPRLRRGRRPQPRVDPGFDRLRLAPDDPRRQPMRDRQPALRGRARCCGPRSSAACWTRRGTTAPAAPSRVPLFESGRAYLRGARARRGRDPGRRLPGEDGRPGPRAARGSPRSPSARSPRASWRGEQPAATSSRSRARSRRSARQLGVEIALEPAAEPFLHPGRAASVRMGDAARDGSASSTPRWRRAWDLPGARRVRDRPRPRDRRISERRERATRTSRRIRRCSRTSPSSSPRTFRRRCAEHGASRPGATCCVRSGSSTSTAASRSGRAQEPRAAARVPGARSDPHRRGGRRAAGGDREAPSRRSGARFVPEDAAARVLVAGASGFSGALAARLVWGHPRLELAAITSRTEAGTRLDEIYPRHRVPLTLEELDLDAADEVDAAIVAYPHGAAAPLVAELRGLGRRGGRPLRGLPPARPARIRALVRAAR